MLRLRNLCAALLQMRDEYSALQGFKPREAAGARPGAAGGKQGGAGAAAAAVAAAAVSKSHTAKLIDSIPAQKYVCCLLHAARAQQHSTCI